MDGIAVIHEWIRSLRKRGEASLLWKLAAPRIFQAGMLALLISGMLLAAGPLHELAHKWLAEDWPAQEGFGLLFWCSYGALLLVPAIAVWRNIEAISSICAEAVAQHRQQPTFRAFYEKQLRSLPMDGNGSKRWELKLRESSLPPTSQATGKTLGELPLRRLFACTVVSIDRQGILIPNPNASTVLYPNDRLFLLGRNKELGEAVKWLQQKAECPPTAGSGTPEITFQKLLVPDCFRHSGVSLADLSLNSLFNIQIVGIERGSERVLIPSHYEDLRPGDQLLVLGTADQVHEMAFWLST